MINDGPVAANSSDGWLGLKVRAKQRERSAVKALRELGGHVTYDYQIGALNPTPPGPWWLRKLVGDDFFANVRWASCNWNTTDADVQQIAVLSSVKRLAFVYSPITDNALHHLKGLKQLELLVIRDTNVSNAGVADLQKSRPSLVIER